jgi:NDP-sugar pyrophosphorylase family protein
MQLVVLAGGKGTRMQHLTRDRPKPLLMVGAQTLIEHILDAFPDEVDEYIFVIGYRGDMIRKTFGRAINGKPVFYAVQDDQHGTYHALLCAKEFLESGSRFFVVNGDDLHGNGAIRKCLNYERALIVSRAEDPRPYGVVECNPFLKVLSITEKPEKPESNLVSTGVYLLDSHVFEFPPRPQNGEYYLSAAVASMLKEYPVFAVETDHWTPVTSPEDLVRLRASIANDRK